MRTGISGGMGVLAESECSPVALPAPHSPVWTIADEEGRSPEDVTKRLDDLIAEIREKWQAPAFKRSKEEADEAPGDVLIVAHGHILRAFAQRWVGQSLQDGPTFLLEAGGVGTLR